MKLHDYLPAALCYCNKDCICISNSCVYICPPVGQDYILLESTVQVTLDETGRDIMLACTRLQIINDELSEGSEFFNLSYIQQSSGIVVASCLVEITDGGTIKYTFICGKI